MDDNSDLNHNIETAIKAARKNKGKTKAWLVVWCEFIYEMWVQRCNGRFQGRSDSHTQASRNILFRAASRLEDNIANYLLI